MQPFQYTSVAGRPGGAGIVGCLRHSPQGYRQYNKYKPWLRDEFLFRCVYCLYRESWTDFGHAVFGVDHAKAKTFYPSEECEYENLLYACNRCNSAKGVKKLPLDPIRD